MKVYLIKHKGANWFGNYRDIGQLRLYGNSSDTEIYFGYSYFRKKDAKRVLDTYGSAIKKYYEIATAEIK